MSVDKSGDVLKFKSGEHLFKEGDPGGSLLIIEAGSVEVYRERSGKQLRLAVARDGEILGVMTLLDGKSRTASARAVTDVSANHISPDKVTKLMGEMPKWAIAFIRDLVVRVEQADELYARAALLDGKEETSQGFVQLSVQVAEGFVPIARMLASAQGRELVIDEVLQQLSDVIGRAYVNARKVFDAMSQAGLLSRNQDGHVRSSFDQLEVLKEYSAFVRAHQRTGALSLMVTLLMPSEREQLKYLITLPKKMGKTGGGVVEIKFSEIEEFFAKQYKTKFLAQAMKQAEFLEIVKIINKDNELAVQFVADELDKRMRFLETLLLVDALEAPKHRLAHQKTLVY